MNEGRPCKRELLDWINVVSFAVDDVKLYLDTHPCDQEALAYFEEYQKQRCFAIKEYAKYYGPLTMDSMEAGQQWRWIQDPWPWQEGGC